MEDLNFILDCLLQSEALNPEHRVTEIGSAAVAGIAKRIRSTDFQGNFRELKTLMRTAFQTAAKDGRRFICAQDVPQARRHALWAWVEKTDTEIVWFIS
jgi:transcriptional regulator with PAS, ATPase and Fis domain